MSMVFKATIRYDMGVNINFHTFLICYFKIKKCIPSTAHIKYSSVMLALYIYIVLDRNKKQNFGNFFCVGLSDNHI